MRRATLGKCKHVHGTYTLLTSEVMAAFHSDLLCMHLISVVSQLLCFLLVIPAKAGTQ
jgi:hypothetical protein